MERVYVRIEKVNLKTALSPGEGEDGGSQSAGYRVVRANHMSEAISSNVCAPSGSLVPETDGVGATTKKKKIWNTAYTPCGGLVQNIHTLDPPGRFLKRNREKPDAGLILVTREGD